MRILVLAEHDGRQIKQATRQAVTAARAWNLPVDLLVAGHEAAAVVAAAARIDGVTRVLRADAAQFAHPLAEDVAALIAAIGPGYRAVIAPHTSAAKNALPRAAALMGVAMVSDVVAIQAPATFLRPIYAGNALATIEATDATLVLTVRPTSFAPAADGGAAEVVDQAAPAPTGRARWVKEMRAVSDRPELATARVVVSGGRSVGDRFDEVLGPLAAKLGAAIGATRAAVDAGYASNDQQVGQTGTVVAPELYIAAGVSGAVQHLAGMKDSRVIVAINLDPDAPIFQVADFGLVADLFEAVPALTRALG